MGTKAYPRIKNAVLLCLLLVGIQLGGGILTGLISQLAGTMQGMDVAGIAAVFEILVLVVGGISVLIPALIGLRKTKRPAAEVFRFHKVSAGLWGATAVLFIGLYILLSELDNLMNFLLPMPEFIQGVFDMVMASPNFIVSLLFVAISPAIVEELLCRGLFLYGFQKNYSARKAIIVSALLFGIIHLNPWQFVSAFTIGLFSAWIALRSHSIFPSMAIHFVNNLLAVLFAQFSELIPVSGFNTPAPNALVFQPIWLDIAGLALTVLGIYLLRRRFPVLPPEPEPPTNNATLMEEADDQAPV
ncbi:MAG: CPBP family intramembrane metalloprotease [Treponema sp.]|jgi:membrane protease YdiL (CAAX protease family)|nr:CPBP family intramembrane metalloprotease [Treponema sp.]